MASPEENKDNKPPEENKLNQPENPNPQIPKEEQEQNEEQPQDSKEPFIKRIFNHEKVTKYYKNQLPPSKSKEKFFDQVFPPIVDSLSDRSGKNDGTDKINILEIDWKKVNELFQNPSLFPNSKKFNQDNKQEEYIEFKISFKQNKGELFSHYTHFYHSISLLTQIPGLIEKIFKTKTINPENYYELYVYIKGEYQILILDDFFPVVKGTSSLRFAKPVKEEIWLPLLEKAFAKTHGGYGSLISCDASDVISTFTGAPVEKINVFDIDNEDLKNLLIKNKNISYIYLLPNDNSKDIGLVQKKVYQLMEIYDISNDENKDNNTVVVKIKNMFEYNKYRGKWSNDGDLFTSDIKSKVNFNPDEKMVLYMSLDYVRKFFKQIHIIYKIFDCNIKQLSINQYNINTPQVFNLFLPNDSLVSFSLIIKSNNNNELSDYEQSLIKTQIIQPACICISQYNPSEKNKFIGFDGCYNSYEFPETARELKAGFYVIWTYIAIEFCKEPIPNQYDLKVCSHEYFKLKYQKDDNKYHLLKNILYNGILQYQGNFIKNDEIFVLSDNYYNFSGLGFQIIINPFKEYYQKWIFKTQVKNMALLYPYSKFEHFEIEVMPDGGFFLLVGIKIDNLKKDNFTFKTYFKTLKYNPEIVQKNDGIEISFDEFCSENVKDDERSFEYYDYLNDEGANLQSQEFKTDKIVYDYLYNNYSNYMNKLNDLQILDKNLENNLKFIEQKNLDGTYVGQVNEKNEKTGRGAFINKINKNYFIGYWKDDKKCGKGTEYDNDDKEIQSGNYENGYLNGEGKKLLSDGSRYEGMFVDGEMDGRGTYFFNDGTQWSGPSVKGVKHGKGTFTDKEGNKTDLEYQNNNKLT